MLHMKRKWWLIMNVKTVVTNEDMSLLSKYPNIDLEIWELRDWILKSWRDGRLSTLQQAFDLSNPEIFDHVAQYFPHIKNNSSNEVMSNMINRLKLLESRYSSTSRMLQDLEIDRRTYMRWLQGQCKPKLHDLIAISQKARVPIDWLLGVA